jgi:hypothetical protein
VSSFHASGNAPHARRWRAAASRCNLAILREISVRAWLSHHSLDEGVTTMPRLASTLLLIGLVCALFAAWSLAVLPLLPVFIPLGVAAPLDLEVTR